MRAGLGAAMLAVLASCVPPPRAEAPVARQPQRWVAVVVAGDGSLPVFDNATGRMLDLLRRSGSAAETVRLSAAPKMLAQPRVMLATRLRVLDAIANLRPGPGEACMVFLTSHGAHGPGVYLAPRTEFISPSDLDSALRSGCGAVPTVVIVSACYTGDFARPPMARPNRIILTAARADRPSFGCGAGVELTNYDGCLLNSLAVPDAGWPAVIASTDACVTKLEARDHEPASDPQSYIGTAVAQLPALGG